MKPTAEQVFFILLAIAVFSNLGSKKEGFNVGGSIRDIGRDVGGGISAVGGAIGEGVADVGGLIGQGAGALGLGYAGGNPDSWDGGSIRPPMDLPRDDGWKGDDRWRRRKRWKRRHERRWREDHDKEDRWDPNRSSNYVDSWRHHDWAGGNSDSWTPKHHDDDDDHHHHRHHHDRHYGDRWRHRRRDEEERQWRRRRRQHERERRRHTRQKAADEAEKARDDRYILKSEIVPPVCPRCPESATCPREKPCPPCPSCPRCPEPAFKCEKVPNYGSRAVGAYVPSGDGHAGGGYDGLGGYRPTAISGDYGGSAGALGGEQNLPLPRLTDFSSF